MALVHTKYEEETGTAQYLVADPTTKKCAVIDTVLNFNISTGEFKPKSANELISIINENGYELEWILETHIHADHVTASNFFKTTYPKAKLGISTHVRKVAKHFAPQYNQTYDENEWNNFWDVYFKEGDEFTIGELKVKIIELAGHTPADIGYYIENDSIFTGDSVFMPDVGTARCDFPGGSPEVLWESIQHLLTTITPSTKIYVGHDYGLGGARPVQTQTTYEEIQTHNIHLKSGTEKEQFVDMRSTRDKNLSLPRLFHASIQLNIRAGHFPTFNSSSPFLVYPISLLPN